VSLSEDYGKVLKWIERDYRFGGLLFGSIRTALSSRLLSRILYQSFATEMKFKNMDSWPMGDFLWKIGSGISDHRDLLPELIRPPLIRSILTGTAKTLRNILTERFFGIRWEAYGRYPTVILKEKRDYFKKSISAPLGITLDPSPDMERMYAVKVRTSSERIFHELGKYGDPDGRILNLRFVKVRRIAGKANQVGAVIEYRVPGMPVSLKIRLARCIPGRSLLFEVGELFANRGKLIFDITPRADSNQRLVIYTAFDFKTGKTALGRIFWNVFRRLFPEYAHDVVWNHSVCLIKGLSEKGGNGSGDHREKSRR
jgi:hypothetical protein